MDGPTFRVYGLFAHRHTIESGQSNGSETVEKTGRNPLDRPFCLVLYFFGPCPGPTGCRPWIPAVNDP